MRYMIVERRHDRYDTDWWILGTNAISQNAIFNSNGSEVPFEWPASQDSAGNVSSATESFIFSRDIHKSEKSEHFALKADLLEHIWKIFTKS